MGLQVWRNIPLQTKLFQNLPEEDLTRAFAAIENAYQNEANGHSRFPGLTDFCDLPGDDGRVYCHEWRGSLMVATSNGNLFRIDRDGNVENVTGVPISGGKRVIFARTGNELVMAAGGPLIRYDGATKTEILSNDAPHSTFVAYIDGYLIAIETGTGRFAYSDPSDFTSWPALNVFSADTLPDVLNAVLVTPFRELLMCGPESIEQYERLANADAPFFRRWGVGDGVAAPYTVCFADNAMWCLNLNREIVRVSGQSSDPRSDDIGRVIEAIPDEALPDAWAGAYPNRPLHINGEKFLPFQFPEAVNSYGTKGLTFVYDYRQKKWFTLYGWDDDLGLPTRWPGWSYWPLHGRVYVGGEGKVYTLDKNSFANGGKVQRMLGRTAHFSELGEIRMDDLRMRLRRGLGGNDSEGVISLRVKRDNKQWTRWVRKGLGKAGQTDMFVYFGGMGCGDTFQFEWMITDNVAVSVQKLEAVVTPLGH